MKTRIKDKEHLEQIFKKFAELDDEILSDKFIVEPNSGLTFGELKNICECIGYHNFLLENEFLEELEKGVLSHCDTFYIDLIGIKEVNFNGDRQYVNFFDRKPDELDICKDGTLRIWFD